MAIISRRDLFRFAGGAAVGTLLSPLPWKLLDDVSIWTQNWSWIPKPPKGAVSLKYTNCALCGSGCAAQVRCIEGQPVSLAGVRSDPSTLGFLCPLGLVAHHLPYHPNRLTQALVRAKGGALRPASLDEATRLVSEKLRLLAEPGQAGSYLAVLDSRSETTASSALQRLLAQFPRSAYLNRPTDGDGLRILGEMVEGDEAWALDIANSKTVLSFGAPLLEGWGSSGRMLARLTDSDRNTKLIHAEPNCSLTARAADLWLSIQPGSETALALGLANVLVAEKLFHPQVTCPDLADDSPYRKLIGEFPPDWVARLTGLQPEVVVQTARTLAHEGPTVVVSNGHVTGPVARAEELAIQGLNLLLGNLDKPGGVLARPTPAESRPTEMAAPQGTGVLRSLAAIPDGSVELMIVDASLTSQTMPWRVIQPKLHPGKAVVVVLAGLPTPWTRRADVVVPAPVFGEAFEEVERNLDDPQDSFRLSARLTEPPPGLFRLLDFVNQAVMTAGFATQSTSSEDAMKQKVTAIHEAGVGTIFSPADGQVKSLADFASPDDLWNALAGGDRWQGSRVEAARTVTRQFTLAGPEAGDLDRMRKTAGELGGLAAVPPSEYPLAVTRARGRAYSSKMSPLLAKITWESGLHAERECLINPVTAAEHGVVGGVTMNLRTPSGRTGASFRLSEEVMPGTVLLSEPGGEDESGLITGPDASGRVMPGRLEEV